MCQTVIPADHLEIDDASEKISIVVPLYNKEKTISRCINSILKNDLRNVSEILIIDDGSTDGSYDLACSFAKRSEKIRVFRQKNSGAASARNFGFSISTANLVLLLDADDEWAQDFISTIQFLLASNSDCILYATAFKFDLGDGRSILPKHYGVPVQDGGGILPNFLLSAAYGVPPVNCSCVGIRKSAWNEVGGFPEGVTHGEDKGFWLSLSFIGSFAWSPNVCSIRYQDAGNNSEETWDPIAGSYYLKKIDALRKEPSALASTQNLQVLYKKELARFGRAAARKRYYGAALKTVFTLSFMGEIGTAILVLVTLLMPSRIYRRVKNRVIRKKAI